MLSKIYPALPLFSALFLILTGVVHFFNFSLGGDWCTGSSCVGPYLFWNEKHVLDDSNARFRELFSFTPTSIARNYIPILLGIVFLRMHTFDESPKPVLVGGLLFIAGVFGSFPFAGGVGILCGFFCCFSAAFGFACAYFDIEPKLWKVRIHESMSCSISGNYLSESSRIISILKALAIFCIFLAILNNWIHIFKNDTHTWCHGHGDDSCVGPWLTWPENSIDTVNLVKGFGETFTLSPDRFLDVFAPTIYCIAFITLTPRITWYKVSMFLLFLSVFGCFGYSGNLGIFIGFFCAAISFCTLIAAIFGIKEDSEMLDIGYSAV